MDCIIGVTITSGLVDRLVWKKDNKIVITYMRDDGSMEFENIDQFFSHLSYLPNTKFVESTMFQ